MKRVLKLCYGLSATGGALILFWGLSHQTTVMFLILIFIAKSGMAGSQNVLYLCFPRIFPTLFATTAYGYCNILARAFTAISPMMSRMEQPLPMITFTTLCVSSFLLVFGLVENDKDADDLTEQANDEEEV